MPGLDLLLVNFTSPIVLAFVLGAVAGFIRSELELPEAVLKLLSIYLLFSIGLTGGRELGKTNFAELSGMLVAGVALTVAIPVITFFVMRRFAGFDAANAGAVAAHYGSVSSVTFFAAVAFARNVGNPSEGYLTAVVALMEWGVIIALLMARWSMGKAAGGAKLTDIMLDTLRGRGILLLTGGMIIGAMATDGQWNQISPFYEQMFRGVLMLFLLEMGMTAARHIRGYVSVGRFMTTFALVSPVVWGVIGVTAGQMAGLSLGGAFVLGAICASASYIDAPAACRAALPSANPGIYLTASLAVTFPFNMLIGLPLFYQYARWLYGA